MSEIKVITMSNMRKGFGVERVQDYKRIRVRKGLSSAVVEVPSRSPLIVSRLVGSVFSSSLSTIVETIQ